MFLESITVNGFIDIAEETTVNFAFQEEVNISICSKTILEAFCIIFDPKYDANVDLTNFISDQFEGKSMVRANFCQNDDSTLMNFSWLKTRHLTIERDLRKQHQVLVNSKAMQIDEFHRAIASFGYVTVNGFHLHRLLKTEINQMSFFSGEELWKILTSIFNSKELVQVVAQKHDKQKLLQEQLSKYTDHLENELVPNRLQIRDQIRQHFKQKKCFNTLLKIASERTLVALERQGKSIQSRQDHLTEKIHQKAKTIQEIKDKEALNKLKQRLVMDRLQLVKKRRGSSLQKLFNSSGVNEGFFDECQTSIATAHKSAVTQLNEVEGQIDACSQLQGEISHIAGQLIAIDWKLFLKQAKDNNKDEYDKQLNTYLKLMTAEEKESSRLMTQIKETDNQIKHCRAQMVENTPAQIKYLETKVKAHYQAQLPVVERTLALYDDIFKNKGTALAIKLDIDTVTSTNGLNELFVETLLEIESFIMTDNSLSIDYLGPVFQYVEARPYIDESVWKKVFKVATIFLFTRGSTARKVNRLLVMSKKNLGSYVFLGIDEFVPRTALKVSEESQAKVKAVESLVQDGLMFGAIVKTLLREALLGETLVVEPASSLVENSDLKIPFDEQIIILQNVYGNVKEFANVLVQVKQSQSLVSQLEEMVERNHEELEELLKKSTTNRSTEILKEFIALLNLQESQKNSYAANSAKLQNLHQMKDVEGSIDLWMPAELEDAKQQKIHEFEKKSKEIQIQERIRKLKLSKSIKSIERDMKTISCCFRKLSYFDGGKVPKEITELFERQANVVESEVKALRQMLPKSTLIPVITSLQIEMIDLKNRLFKENSERSVTDHAIKICQQDDYIDEHLYEEKKRTDITEDLRQCYRQLLTDKSKTMSFQTLSKESYVHLYQSILNVTRYSESPDPKYVQNKVALKSFPLLNKAAVKVLKDTVKNYQTSFAQVMEGYIRKSTLVFYSRGVFDELNEDQFSWTSFDLGRLKSLDFVVKWRRDCRESISLSSLSKIKAILLITHIVNYISVFKFIVIDKSFFDDMNESIRQKLQTFLEIISSFVQIIYHESIEPTAIP